MSVLEITGYGYRKRDCKSVALWFLNTYVSRYKIYLEICHRGLKHEKVHGYCDFTGKSYRPREFLIELDTYMPKELYIKTLLHELVHLRQWLNGSLRLHKGKMCYNLECVEDYDYEDQPHEIEARQQEKILYLKYFDL